MAREFVQSGVTEQQILDYSKTRQGLNVYCDKEGNPKFLLLNTNEKIDKAFVAMIEWYQDNGAENIVDCLYNNGIVAFCAMTGTEKGNGSATFFKEGIYGLSMNVDSVKKETDSALKYIFIKQSVVESVAIKLDNLSLAFGDISNDAMAYIEIGKNILMEDNYNYKNKETKVKWYGV